METSKVYSKFLIILHSYLMNSALNLFKINSKSVLATVSTLSRPALVIASRAASLTRLSKSAPGNPSVSEKKNKG